MRTPIYFNETFNIGDPHTNACVGNNGIQDHETYGLGFDEATKILIKAAHDGSATIDAAIYPLVFCARHRIELFIKDQLMKFKKIRDNSEITEQLLISTHDLEKLWDLLKKNAKTTDRRMLDFVKNAEEYIIDFAEIDPTGETFRYPYSKYKTQHLINTPIINISVFEKRYSGLSELFEEFEYLTNYLIYEYQHGTFTDELSRDDIYEISQMLPPKKNWRMEIFDRAKTEIKDKFNLSNRKLSKAIDIIKSHREFCVEIGLEQPLTQLKTETLAKYIEIYNKLHGKRLNENSAIDGKTINAEWKKGSGCIGEMQSILPRESIVCIFTLVELGKLNYFGEEFDFLYKKYDTEAEYEDDITSYCSFITRNINALRHIKKALRKIGQKSLQEAYSNATQQFKIA